MPEVFLSYRQTSDTERQRVRAFAERLRSSGISVILDQFFLEEHPGGPNDGWDKWSSDRALQTSHVIIIGSESWFQCFDKTQPPGTGLGAACEADDIRHRVYEANGIVETIRVVLFDDADSKHISPKLKRYHRFHADRDFDNIRRWLNGGPSPATQPAVPTSSFIPPPSSFRHNLPTIQRFFGRDTELAKLIPDLYPDATGWGALIDGPGGMGKTTLAIRAAELAAPGHYDDILFLSAKQTAMDPHGPHDESPFAVSGFTQMLDAIARRLQKPEITQAPPTSAHASSSTPSPAPAPSSSSTTSKPSPTPTSAASSPSSATSRAPAKPSSPAAPSSSPPADGSNSSSSTKPPPSRPSPTSPATTPPSPPPPPRMKPAADDSPSSPPRHHIYTPQASTAASQRTANNRQTPAPSGPAAQSQSSPDRGGQR